VEAITSVLARFRHRTGEGSARRPGTRVLVPTAIVVVTLGIVAAALAFSAYQRERDSVVQELGLRARAAAADVDRYLGQQFDTLRAVAETQSVAERDLPRVKSYLDRLGETIPGFEGGIGFIDHRGITLARSGYDGPPVDTSQREYVQTVLATGEAYVSSVLISIVGDYPIFLLAVPAPSTDGTPGLVAAAVRLDRVTDRAGSLRSAGASQVFIVDRAGHLVVGAEPVTELVSVESLPWYAAARGAPAGVFTDVQGIGAGDDIVAFANAPTGDWLVVVEATSATILGIAWQALLTQLIVVVLVTLASLAALLVASRKLGTAARDQERAYQSEHAARSRAEEAVARAESVLSQLEERERLREAFIGMLSHELRTPVTTIYGAAKLLARSNPGGDEHGLVGDIEEESDRLYRMVEDLLVLLRAERGQLELSVEPVLLQRLVPIIVRDVERRFPAARIQVERAEDLPPVMTDPGPVRQVLNNLLTNAAKYGGGSPIRVVLAQDGPMLCLAVEDQGPGFAAEEADRLFELFYRSGSTARMSAGTGIGLYVVRQLVLAMGGTVTAEPREGGGARFTINLPLAEGHVELTEEPPIRVTGEELGRRSEDPAGPLATHGPLVTSLPAPPGQTGTP
jgi:signal transduction histidine kinase